MKHNLRQIRKRRRDGYKQRYWVRRNYGSIWPQSQDMVDYINKQNNIHIFTHTDLDGLTSAAMLKRIAQRLGKNVDITPLNPEQVQKTDLPKGSIVVDLPYPNKSDYKDVFYIDHHVGNKKFVPPELRGIFEDRSPSATHLVASLSRRVGIKPFKEDVAAVNKIDSARLTKKDVLSPDIYGKLSMSLKTGELDTDKEYFNKIIDKVTDNPIKKLIDVEMEQRFEKKNKEQDMGEILAKPFTKEVGNIFFTDFKEVDKPPRTNIFKMQAKHEDKPFFYQEVTPFDFKSKTMEKDKVKLTISKNVFNKKDVDLFKDVIGPLGQNDPSVVTYGHKGIAGAIVPKTKVDEIRKKIFGKING